MVAAATDSFLPDTPGQFPGLRAHPVTPAIRLGLARTAPVNRFGGGC
jgi:hypothetical protein